MLALSDKIKRIKRQCQMLIGRRYEINADNYSNLIDQSALVDSASTSSQYSAASGAAEHSQRVLPECTIANVDIRSNLLRGWYMLEARGAKSTIGSNIGLTAYKSTVYKDEKSAQPFVQSCQTIDKQVLDADLSKVEPFHARQQWNLLLGSHESSKRIIYCPDKYDSLAVCLDGRVSHEDLPAIALVRLSTWFASSRIKRKIRFASRFTSQLNAKAKASQQGHKQDVSAFPPVAKPGLSDQYALYNKLMERHCIPLSYREWVDNNASIPGRDIPTFNARQPGPRSIAIYIASSDIDNPQLNQYPSISENKFNAALASSIQHVAQTYSVDITVLGNASIINELVQSKLQLPRATQLEPVLLDHTNSDRRLQQIGECVADYWVFIESSVLPRVDALTQMLGQTVLDTKLKLLYSDNDTIDDYGRRKDPVFKPDWNRELLHNTNYIGGLFLIDDSTFEKAGLLRTDLGLSGLYLMLLQSSRFLESRQVKRIPEVLYHRYYDEYSLSRMNIPNYLWRAERDVIALSTYVESMRNSNDLTNANAAWKTNRGYLNDTPSTNLSPQSMRVVAGELPGTFNIRSLPIKHGSNAPSDLSLPGTVPRVDIIIPTRDKVSVLKTCISSILRKTDYPSFNIIVVDNGSCETETKRYYNLIESDSRITIISAPGEFNYSLLNNQAVHRSTADVVVLLNNDTEVISPDWLDVLADYAVRPEIGCVGAKLYYSNNRVQHGGVIIGLKGMAGHAHRFANRFDDGYCGRLKMSQNMSAVTAACLAVRRSVYRSVGGLDEKNLKVAYNDVDFCLRVLEAGYQNVWTPQAELFHHESVSRGSDDTPTKRIRFQQEYNYMLTRWNMSERDDPAYNPNLTKDLEDFSLAA